MKFKPGTVERNSSSTIQVPQQESKPLQIYQHHNSKHSSHSYRNKRKNINHYITLTRTGMELSGNSTEYTTFQRVLSLSIGIFLLLTSLGSIVANTLLLSAIYCDPLKCFRTVPIVFIANLALADLLTGLIVDPLYATHAFGIFQNEEYTMTLTVGDYNSYITVNNAIVTVVILLIDRSVAIKKPFMYRRLMTLKTAVIIVAVSWLYSGFFSTFRLMGMSDEAYILLDTHLHVTFAFLSLTCLFRFIYSNLKTEKRKKLREVCSMEHIDNETKEKLQEMKTDKRLLVTIFLILFLFFLTFSPYAIFIHLEFYCSACHDSKVYFFLCKASEPIVYLNSVLNPFIYAWRHENFRKALMWVVKCRGRKKQREHRKNGTNLENTTEERVVA